MFLTTKNVMIAVTRPIVSEVHGLQGMAIPQGNPGIKIRNSPENLAVNAGQYPEAIDQNHQQQDQADGQVDSGKKRPIPNLFFYPIWICHQASSINGGTTGFRNFMTDSIRTFSLIYRYPRDFNFCLSS
jgi:hypothetical protein